MLVAEIRVLVWAATEAAREQDVISAGGRIRVAGVNVCDDLATSWLILAKIPTKVRKASQDCDSW